MEVLRVLGRKQKSWLLIAERAASERQKGRVVVPNGNKNNLEEGKQIDKSLKCARKIEPEL